VLALAACSSDDNSAAPADSRTSPGQDATTAEVLAAPGAALKCASNGTKDAFDTYGAPAFVKVNESIFTNVATESANSGTSNLGDAFTHVGKADTLPPSTTADGLDDFKGNLAAFLVYAYGGPTSITYGTANKSYYGPQDMAAAHIGLHITSSQYDYFVNNIVVPALTTNGVPTGDVSSCFAPVLVDPSFKNKIIMDGAGQGAGASLKCASSSTGANAFTTYGASAFVAVNESIFTNVTNEMTAHSTTNLGTAFTHIGDKTLPSTQDDLAAFKGNLAAFLVYTYGGPTSIAYTDSVTYYGPQDMTASHVGLNIDSSQYDYFVNNIVVPALTTNGVPMSDVSSCFAPTLVDPGFKASIVGH
jgi:hypothetical protein